MVKVHLFLALAIAFVAHSNDHITIHKDGEQTYQVKKEELFSKDLGYPFYESDRVEQLLDKVDKAISKSPVNASIDKEGTIVDGSNGYKLNRDAFREGVLQSPLSKWVNLASTRAHHSLSESKRGTFIID